MSILELRQYTMVPGRRQEFADIFDREFVESQEAVGIEVVGQFLDLDRPDRFVWIRRFPDMTARADALEAFYSSQAWAKHKDAANATMTEWHDVLLLRPVDPEFDLPICAGDRPPHGRAPAPQAPLAIVVWDVPPDEIDGSVGSAIRAVQAVRAVFVTERSPNTYPRLPVREDASAVVAVVDAVPSADGGTLGVRSPSQVLRLAPTPRSALRGF